MAVNTHIPPRRKLRLGRSEGYRPQYKRVILTLKKGQSLNFDVLALQSPPSVVRMLNQNVDLQCGFTMWIYNVDLQCGFTMWIYNVDLQCGFTMWIYNVDLQYDNSNQLDIFMGIRLLHAFTPGTRNRSVSDFAEITAREPEKALTSGFHRARGRNNRGVITSRHLGGGHKRLYRLIDFKRDKIGVTAKVVSIEYDPNRNARIALLRYMDGDKRYILHPAGLKVGDTVVSDLNAPILVGNALPLRNIPLGTEIHNVEFKPGSGGQMARAAGARIEILAKEGNLVTLRLPSKEIRLISKHCWATLGSVGNVEIYNLTLGKAGRVRWMGKRPTVRGSAMNPVDHPHGGGEGRCPIGRAAPVTPWGRPTLGSRTRKPKKYSNAFILRPRKK